MTEQQYAISKYPDTVEVYARLKNLVVQPIRPVRRERMQEYLNYYETKCARSKALNDEAQKLIPGVMLLDLHNPLKLARELKPRKHMLEEMGAAYMANGLITLAGSRMYTSMADTEAVINEALEKFEGVLTSVEGL